MGEKDYFGAVSPINQRLIAFQICFEPAIVPKKNLQKGWLKASKMAKNILVELKKAQRHEIALKMIPRVYSL